MPAYPTTHHKLHPRQAMTWSPERISGPLDRVIRGRVHTDEHDGSPPTLIVRAQAEGIVVSTTLAANGRFTLTLPDLVEGRLTLEVLDVSGEILTSETMNVDAAAPTLRLPATVFDSPRERSSARPPLFGVDELQGLRSALSRLRSDGQVGEGAERTAELAIGTSAWVDGLFPDASAVLRGDADAAARLRLALLPLSGEAPRLRHGPSVWRTGTLTREQRTSVGLLAVAAIRAADDLEETNGLLAGLSVALDSLPWLGAALQTAQLDAPGLPSLFGPDMPVPPPLDLGPFPPPLDLKPVPPPDLSIFPKKKVPVIVKDLDAPGGLRLETPIYMEPCILRAMVAAAAAQAANPHWVISGFSPPDACPGELLTLVGTGFGAKQGTVNFPTADSSFGQSVAAERWSDTQISVRVPVDAVPGKLSLTVFDGVIQMCGGEFPIFRRGSSSADFSGGRPRVTNLYLREAGVPVDPPLAAPGRAVELVVASSSGDGITLDVVVTQGATQLAAFRGLPGGYHVLSFTAPATARPLPVQAVAEVRNRCMTTRRTLDFTVAVAPNPRIRAMEVIQAVQRPNPLDGGGTTRVRLVERKRTVLRVYAESGLGPEFSMGSAPGQVSLAGDVRMTKSGGEVITISSSGSYAAPTVPDRRSALEFELPWLELEGTVKLEVRVWPAVTLPGAAGAWESTRSMHATFQARRPYTLVRVQIQTGEPGSPPTEGQWRRNVDGIRERIPLSDDEIIEGIGSRVIIGSGDADLTTGKAGWADLLDHLEEFADDHEAIQGVFLGVVTNNPSWGTINGIAHTPGPAMLARAGLRATSAHEFGHTRGLGHANAGPGIDPKSIDARLPTTTEADSLGWRARDSHLFPGPWAELMGYQTPPAPDGYQDRWPSVTTWDLLFDGFA